MTTLGPNHGLRNPHLGNPHLIVVVVSMNKDIRSTNSLRVVFLMYSVRVIVGYVFLIDIVGDILDLICSYDH